MSQYPNNAMVAGCGGDNPYIDWPGGCPYWPGFYGYGYPYGYGAGQQANVADAQAQRVVNNIYVIKKEVPMDAAVGACGGNGPGFPYPVVIAGGVARPFYAGAGVGQYQPPAGMPGSDGGFDITMNIAPGYVLRVDPYRGQGNVMLAITLDTPYGPVEALGRVSEETFRRMLAEGRARLAPRIQRWLQRMMQKYGTMAVALPPSGVPATPTTPAIDVLDVDVSRLTPPDAGMGAGVGQWYDDSLAAYDTPETMEAMPAYDWPTYPIYLRRRMRRRRPWWLRRNWYWWLSPWQGWYNPYYPGNFPYGPYYLNGQWVYGPPQLQGASYSVNGQPVTQGGAPIPSGQQGGAMSAGVGQYWGSAPMAPNRFGANDRPFFAPRKV